jgi:hypothetical protein
MVSDHFFNFILEKTTLMIFVPGVPSDIMKKKLFFYKLKLDVLSESGMLITNIIMGPGHYAEEIRSQR